MIPDRVYAHAKGSTYNIKMIAKSGLSLDSVKEKIGLYRLSYLIMERNPDGKSVN